MAQINVSVNGIREEYPVTYKSKVLKSNVSFASQVTDEDTLYIIKWDFDLGGATVTIPQNCILQFEGGVLTHGTVQLQGTKVWPCYDALTEGNIYIIGHPATGTVGYIENTIKWYNGEGWQIAGEQELFYKEYTKNHNNSAFIYDGNTIASDYDYYNIPVNDIMLARSNSFYNTIKYGFTKCKAYFIKDGSATVFFKNLDLPYTIPDGDLSTLAGKTGYTLHLINDGKVVSRNMRIVY